ncbi:unnamed protein product [Clonostachys rhizophaga]|uniref:Uncharacterized protein n=1 Tax=Clonostachys rhizophaga TaxID=160324 RepID=A0A9N9YQ64_9HYPO|nr:unnamed protein product [Clonostachys rhizophaga]
MDAHSMDDQDQIRDTRRKREVKIEELRLEKFMRKILVQRLSVIEDAVEATCDHNSTLAEIMGTVETTLKAYGQDFKGIPPCPTFGVTSLEAWLRVFMAEVFAKKDNIQDELRDITQQLTRLKKERDEEESK